jgi:predicted flavoprotein YhiN
VRGTSGREYKADAVLVATGGLSYPTTGSTGDGYKLARQAGHTLVEPVPSLVSLVSHDADCKKMMGLALKNVTLTLHEDGKAIFEDAVHPLRHQRAADPQRVESSGRHEKAQVRSFY